MARDLRLVTQFRRTERVDSARVALMKALPGEPCGRSADVMRRDTEAYLTRLFGREVKILAPAKP